MIELIGGIEKPHETEVVELKEAKHDFSFKDLGRYFSALSNEAVLRGKQDAWLLFGIDNDKAVCGTAYRRDNPTKLQSLKREVAGHTNNRMTFREIHELERRMLSATNVRPRRSEPRRGHHLRQVDQ